MCSLTSAWAATAPATRPAPPRLSAPGPSGHGPVASSARTRAGPRQPQTASRAASGTAPGAPGLASRSFRRPAGGPRRTPRKSRAAGGCGARSWRGGWPSAGRCGVGRHGLRSAAARRSTLRRPGTARRSSSRPCSASAPLLQGYTSHPSVLCGLCAPAWPPSVLTQCRDGAAARALLRSPVPPVSCRGMVLPCWQPPGARARWRAPRGRSR